MDNYNISTSNIKQIIDYCKHCNYFDAQTAFLVQTNHSNVVTIVAIYAEDVNLFSNISVSENAVYKIIKLSLTDFYKFLLSRDLLFGEILSKAIFIKDDLEIAAKAQLAVQPIMTYNLNQQNTIVETKCLFREQKIDETSDNFTMLFLDESDFDTFLSCVFLPLSKFIKQDLYETNFMLQTHRYNDRLSIELTYFVPSGKRTEMLKKLQKELYDKVSDYKLHKIILPYKKPIGVIDTMPSNVKKDIYEILSMISEEVVISYSKKPLDDNTNVALLIYHLLSSAIYYFDTKEDFTEVNNELYQALLPDSVSLLTFHLLSGGVISSLKDKIEREYNLLAKKIYPNLHANYSEMLEVWDANIIKDDDLSPYLSKLSDISKITNWESICIPQYPPSQMNSKTLFFTEYYKHILKCFDVSSYYKAFIPFAIKYLIKNEI